MEGLVPPLLLVGMLLVFWLLVVRPGVRRERERRAMQGELAVGDHIILTSGFFGRIVAVRGDRADIELAPGTTVTVALGAVAGLDPEAPSASVAPDLNKTAPNLDKSAADAETSTPPEEI